MESKGVELRKSMRRRSTIEDIQNVSDRTSLSPDKIMELRLKFKKATGETGRIDRETFGKIILDQGICKADCPDKASSDSLAELAFRVFDENNDGFINFVEFQTAVWVCERYYIHHDIVFLFSVGQVHWVHFRSIFKSLFSVKLSVTRTMYFYDSGNKLLVVQ